MVDPFLPGLLDRIDPPKKVAILRASRIGDFLCAIPAFHALRDKLPEADIAIVTLPMLADLARRISLIDRVIEFPGYPGIAEQLFDPRRAADFFLRMQTEEFDLAVQLQGSGLNSNPFTLMLGAKRSAGFIRPGDPPGRMDAVLPEPRTGHEVDRVLALPQFLGAPACGDEIRLDLRPADFVQAEELIGDLEPPVIGIHTGARDRTRRWPAARFFSVAWQLLERYGGSIVLIGESNEDGAAVWDDPLPKSRVRSLGGKTSLPVLAAVISHLALMVTNDSGPAHLAYALKTPCVTIFGSADPQRYGPYQAGPYRLLVHQITCRPCGLPECPIGYPCLENVTVDQATAAAHEVIDLKRT